MSTQISGFHSLTPLRPGPAGERFAAFSEQLQRQVMLEVLPAAVLADPAAARRDAEHASTFVHPTVATPLLVAALPDGGFCMAFEPLEGAPLADVLAQRGPMIPDDALLLFGELSGGLTQLHQAGVVHGDVRPENIHLVGMATSHRPRLLGLGGAWLKASARPRPTAWTAPECVDGAAPTVKADLYAAGAVLYATLSGRPPYDARDVDALRAHQRTGSPAALPPASAHLYEVVRRCLHPDPGKRFGTALEMARTLNTQNGTLVTPAGGMPAITGAAVSADAKGPGDTLGSYQLVRQLGEGAMGRVFLARHALLGRQVAIKLLRAEQYARTELIQRFFQEARTVNQINHEHIVEIIDFVQEPGPHGPSAVYCVMELLDGATLAGVLDHEAVPVRRGLSIVLQLCDALAAAHQVGVVHRDVKPDNIFLIERGGKKDYVKVLDFGVAKLTTKGLDGPVVATVDGAVIGTPVYMAPEQAAAAAVDHRADLYAVGVILYRLLSGKLPFDGENFLVIASRVLTQPPPPLPEVTPAGEPIPKELAALVMQCLAKDAKDRPASVRVLRQALEPFAHGTHVPADAPVEVPRRSGLKALLAVAVLAVVGGGLLVTKPWEGANGDKPRVVVPPLPDEPDAAVEADAGPAVVPPSEVDAGAPAPAVDAGATEPADAGTVAEPKVPRRPPGPLTAREIGEVFGRANRDIVRCLERHRTLLAGGSGKVDVSVTIELSGAVSAVRVPTAGLPGTPLEACMVQQVKKLRFPKHTGKVITVNVPFSYKQE